MPFSSVMHVGFADLPDRNFGPVGRVAAILLMIVLILLLVKKIGYR